MRILVVNFFPAFHPPRSGGEQRYYYLYHHLSQHVDVTLLSPTYSTHPPEVMTFSPTFREHRVPKDQVFDRLHWELDAAGIGPECSAYVVSLAAGADTEFGRRFQALVAEHDVVIHESPFTLGYDRTLGEDGKPRVYNAYNVETRLQGQILRGDAGRKAVEFIRFLEQSLVAASRLVFATCEEERRLFVEDFGIDPARTALAPNGFEAVAPGAPAPGPSSAHGDPYAVFMGSAHPPNVEAARFLVERVAPALPELEFRIMGAVCDHLPKRLPRNVTSLGFVAEADKRNQLERCVAALNPLFSGAGTNLKMLDYMAAGAPIVTTAIGARGLAFEHGVDAFISDGPAYVETLRAVVTSPTTAHAAGTAAKKKAFADYTWERIADHFREALLSALRPAERADVARPLLLVVNDFPVAQATSGGQVRIRELATELGREFDVVLLCLTGEPRRRERRLTDGFTELSIPKTDEHRDAEARSRRESRVSIDDLLAADFCAHNAEFEAAFCGFAARAAAVVFEHPYLAPLLDLLPPMMPVVYSSLNVERDLKTETLRSRSDAARRIARVAGLEAQLLDRADLVVCVSDGDRDRFRETHPDRRYEVIVSGARPEPRHVSANGRPAAGSDPLHGRPLAVFLGSGHPPNVAAAKFLVDTVAPATPEMTIGLIGSVCGAEELDGAPANVVRFGVLAEAEKNVLLERATLAVNPLFEGGGSSLKVADFFAAGLPLVSTRVGVRGYDVADGEQYLAATHDDFAATTRRLARDDALRRRLATNARTFYETVLDWRVLGARYRRVVRSVIGRGGCRRALVVTYRFADPPPGGAEAFLVNVLRELGRRGALEIDVATCDVGAITNKWHFSARYDAPDRPAPDPDYVRAVHRFPVDPAHVRDYAGCARLFAVWMEESREQAGGFRDAYDRPLLLGGWNYPETYGGTLARWTSREAQIFVGAGASAMRLAAVPPQTMRLEVLRGGDVVATRAVGDALEWTVDLPGDDPIVTLRVTATFVGRDDPRELGVLVRELAVRDDAGWTPVDFGDDFGAVARRRHPERWVRSLVGLAERRAAADDDLFVAVRGPHSRELRRWLEDCVASYDVVLVQGVPFATPAIVMDVATRQGVPVVVLPHFHMEDRYYHWRRYYDVFRQAACVIASSPGVKALVFDQVGATSVALAGGGVDLGEYEAGDVEARRRAFRAMHPSPTPFVLVLGRKVLSKNYGMVVDAVAAANRDGHRVDLVLIGPDEDGIPLMAPHTFYYGAQPRDVVLGALSAALCLANMSESESFGIVLLEAWLSGRPVVAQRRCLAFTDLVVPGENGFLAEAPDEVARAIDAYLADPDLAARHGAAGKRAAEDYSWSRLAARIERVLIDAAPATAPQQAARDYHV